VAVPSEPATIVIVCPIMAAPLALTSRKSTLLPVLVGATMAGIVVPLRAAPVTAKGAVAARDPLVARTVTTRFDGSAPIETTAVD
jgi:hypothetical protein